MDGNLCHVVWVGLWSRLLMIVIVVMTTPEVEVVASVVGATLFGRHARGHLGAGLVVVQTVTASIVWQLSIVGSCPGQKSTCRMVGKG
jgi:hypothetical protein